jgi:hypothetical protein
MLFLYLSDLALPGCTVANYTVSLAHCHSRLACPCKLAIDEDSVWVRTPLHGHMLWYQFAACYMLAFCRFEEMRY